MTRHLPWIALAIVGAGALGVVATVRGEPINALWIVAAAVSVYLIAYRYYALFIARVIGIDPSRPTPAIRRADGLDYVATDRTVLFGHHFAAIAGAGPLVGPVLAAQMGYLPGTLWILAGVVLAGAVQDFLVLFLSMRRDGRSLGELIRMEMGPVAGTIALFGAFMIMVIILAVLALIVVRALAESPWGLFTVAATVPLAMLMGGYTRWVRPGKIGEVSIIGFIGLILAIVYGQSIAQSAVLAPLFTFTPVQLCFLLIGYGAVASVLPVWLLLAPRDYLSTFLKIGAIVALAIGIVIMAPPLKMPALTKFIDGSGPVWAGPLFPFLFITIACGAVSGFHALIASGTTPKLIASEKDAPFIGYGAMLMESAVAIMALVAASILDPGVYFAMNAPAAVLGTDPASAAAAVTAMGFPISADTLAQVAKDVGEHTIISRAGGAPTLAVAIAEIFSHLFGGQTMKAFWYHFAILFEALFILTAVDAGTRAGRFMLQDLIGLVVPSFRGSSKVAPGLIATGLCVAAWGFFLYQGVTDPLGGVNTLWPLFGISNQMLAAVALMLATVVLFRMKKDRYAWITVVPTVWLLACTLTAGWLKIFSADPRVGFLAHADKFAGAAAEGKVLAPAKTMAEMGRIVFNDRIDAGLCAIFLGVVLAILVYAVRTCLIARRIDRPSVTEIPPEMVAAE
ncbi:carbon starvation protein A [Sphingomonas paucimobilis]|uniref:Carbon starvation protein A n=2 Tax=Sphingomonas paucimobilis TaxID=13689 RepID=A0A7Y2PF36_SPHPI|nr:MULTISPECIES: carbon starvation CstA family protein [Sphingomonas]MCM3680054.1 carbon starvation protein A [Sphingomonas paucimobilis]MDG5970550.1 carbon starvation protein A [Sphingomonas paucimobilis]NNG58766.1 carbon starvation protein A [Sphingomonas paucimobilis]QPS15242.1 carbon starvation protein A [Sphingomonas paucimobilis]QPT09938.1 carbon starvation protein A [Sphingomonas paucimobilis]